MLSSSRSKANGFSLRGCGSERCRRRVPGAGQAWRSVSAGTNTESLSGAGIADRCPSACGTGVQGCQELVEGALHEARRSSADGRGCEGPEEPPGLATEVDLIKDISCRDRLDNPLNQYLGCRHNLCLMLNVKQKVCHLPWDGFSGPALPL